MAYGFEPDLVPFLTGDGRNGLLLEYLYFTDSRGHMWRTKTSSDGLSTPSWLWPFIPPFGKRTWKSGVLHDGGYRDKIEIYRNRRWFRITLDEQECNWLIKDGLRAQKASRYERFVIYVALEWFGWRAFSLDRKKATVLSKGRHRIDRATGWVGTAMTA